MIASIVLSKMHFEAQYTDDTVQRISLLLLYLMPGSGSIAWRASFLQYTAMIPFSLLFTIDYR